MKKLFLVAVITCLTSCVPLTPNQTSKSDPEERETYITPKRATTYMVDLCDPENMPRFPRRPRLEGRELSKLTEEQMDARIKQHITQMENHITVLENTIVKTRQRVEQCR